MVSSFRGLGWDLGVWGKLTNSSGLECYGLEFMDWSLWGLHPC